MMCDLSKFTETKPALARPYSRGPQNIIMPDYQVVRLSEGCPHRCAWCYEWREIGNNWQIFPLPEIVRSDVRITDMNLIAKQEALEIINQFRDIRVSGKVVYPRLVCGIDYRFLTPAIAEALKNNRFVGPHIAWDNHISEDRRVKAAVKMLLKAGYRHDDISIFMICNHPKITYDESLYKLELCKYWNIKVNDCYFDNQVMPNVRSIGWSDIQLRDFRHKVRKHNQYCVFHSDPELRRVGR